MDQLKLQEIIKQADLRRLAESAGADLEQHGDELRGPCPIHGGNNKTAFVIWPKGGNLDKDVWRCYTGCDKGGDALSFFMAWKGYADFEQGLEEFCKYLGIEPDWKPDPQQIEEAKKQRLREDVLEEADRYYAALLWSDKGKPALDYIRKRGLTDPTIKALRWGFSDSGPGVYEHLKAKGFNLDTAFNARLVRSDKDDFTANGDGKIKGPNGFIIFPHFVYERCVYFSSRAVELEGKPLPDPKDKSRNLPGSKQVYRAEQRGKAGQVVTMLEGPFDAATVYQLGYSAWAMMGLSGIGKEEIHDLQHKEAIYLATDADQAGQEKITNADSRLVKMCKALGPLTMILPAIPETVKQKDFNDWLYKAKKPITKEDFQKLLKGAETWYETRLHQVKECEPWERDRRMLEVGQMISAAPDASRAWFYRRAQEILSMTKKEIHELTSTAARNNGSALGQIRGEQIVFAGRPMGNFWARITHELSMEDGQNPPVIQFTLIGGLNDGSKLQTVTIDASEFMGMQWITKQWGARPIPYVSRSGLFELARAILEVSNEMSRERVFTYTGWADIDGRKSYLTRSGRITADGWDPETRVDLGPNNLRFYSLPCPPEGSDAMKAVRASVDFLKIGARSVTAMLWAAMYAAPLTSIMPLYAVLWVYGTTQTGKSTITMLALTHFGKEFIDGRQYHAPWEFSLSTFASIEGAAFVTKDIPFVIDDFAPNFASKGEAMNLHRIAQMVVRSVGNRSGRGRSSANMKEQVTRPPRGLVIVTAENPLTGQGIVGRLIYVPVAKGDIIPEGDTMNAKLSEGQEIGQAGLYSQAMAIYVQWLSAHWDEVAADLRTRADGQASWMRQKYPNIQSRLPDYFGLLWAAQDLALEAFQDLGFISYHERRAESDANKESLIKVIVQQAEAISAESPVRKVFQAIGALLQRKKVYLSPRRSDGFVPPENADLVGWFDPLDKTKVYFETDTILTVAKAYYRGLDENLDIFSDTLRRQIDQAGILAERDKDHIEVKPRIDGRLVRVLSISTDRVEALYGVQLIQNEDSGD